MFLKTSFLSLGISFLALSLGVSAAPRLALVPPLTFPGIPVAVGSAGPNLSVDTRNLGDGTIHLAVTASVAWLVPSVGMAHTCGFSQCTPVLIALQTASLAQGSYTGSVTVNDPNALDAPQTISVTVEVGGGVPDALEFFDAPGGSSSATVIAGGRLKTSVSTQSGGNWLSISQGLSDNVFSLPYTVTAKASSSMAVGDYHGRIVLSKSPFALDNKTIEVTLHVTTEPIAQASPTVTFQIAQGGAKETAGVGISNSGEGMLSISNVTATTASGGNWLTAAAATGGVSITADPSTLMAGVYQGTVTVTSNAVNSPTMITVTLNAEAQGPPVAAAGGVVNNGTFGGGESLAQGDIVALFGDQLTFGVPQQAKSLPLMTDLGGTEVLLNDKPVPLYYVSAGQINFQIPFEAATGDGTVSVMRNGTAGNKAFVNIAARVPRLVFLGAGPYAIIVVAGTATLTGIPGAPVHAGDTITIYAVGMGATTPAVASGVASPSKPLAELPAGTQICFGNSSPFQPPPVCTGVLFAGLTPGLEGLYQINVTIPKGVPKGASVPLYVHSAGQITSEVAIVVQ